MLLVETDTYTGLHAWMSTVTSVTQGLSAVIRCLPSFYIKQVSEIMHNSSAPALDTQAHSNLPVVVGGPLAFRAARAMARAHIRGSGLILRCLRRLGVLNVIAQYELNHAKFNVPLYRLPWNLRDVLNYEARFVDAFARAVAPLQGTVFFDCGADFGTFTVLLCARATQISRIIAFEPSATACELLRTNLGNLNVPSEIVPEAVSRSEGWGQLVRPQSGPSDDCARFLATGSGPIHVTTIDSRGVIGGDIAIKLDLEGGELDALIGARKTIESARNCVIGLEANPAVKQRTGIDPVECLKFLDSVRPFQFVVSETGKRVGTSAPILNNNQTDIWNVVGRSYAETLNN